MKKFKKQVRDGEVIPHAPSDSGIAVKNSDAVFDALSKVGDFLPRLQLVGSSSDLAKEGTIQQGNYALIGGKDSVTDLGKSVDVLVLAWRPKALDMSDMDHILSSYDFESALFKDIASKADVKDSGCMFGVEFLVWISSVQKFGTFFMGSKTGRVAAPKVRIFLGKGCTLKSQLITKGKYKWHGPTAQPCLAPGVPPDAAKADEEMQKFLNPPETKVEMADSATDRET